MERAVVDVAGRLGGDVHALLDITVVNVALPSIRGDSTQASRICSGCSTRTR